MTLEDDQGPPRKRQRHSSERQSSSCRRMLLEEIDLEVALRERLASTIESRVTWALLLQEALEKDLRHPGFDSAAEYRTAALNALEAIEAPCNPVFSRDVRLPPPRPAPVPAAPAHAIEPTPAPAPPPSAYSTRNRGAPRAVRPPPRKLLFLRNTATYPPQIAKLACRDCSRTDFSSLQGLLNHCRLSHKREFGSHDECVQCCAVLVESPEDQAWVASNGTEVGGITIPGLRRLFELAVEGGRDVPFLPTMKVDAPSQDAGPSDSTTQPEGHQAGSRESSAPITRTLAHHADSPALAPFLGRGAKQRTIHVHNEDHPVDIFGDAGSAHQKTHWRMPYLHRNKARAALNEIVAPPTLSADKASERSAPANETVAPFIPGPMSRFHMTARVSVRDLSFWIPPSRRIATRPEHTHRWRLAVSSPSYSLPLDAILKKMTVRSVTDPPPSALLEPIIVNNPPFVVTSTTDEPFLARITFEWAGADGQNPPMDVEHWVDLDPLRQSYAVLGEEQVFDVGLDRSTELLPVRSEQMKEASWEVDSVFENSTAADAAPAVPEAAKSEPDYVVRLRSLVPQFPLTLKDSRGRLSRQVAYTLVATPAQFRILNDGRRKAIEWGRAHALHQAYEQLCISEPWLDGRQDIQLTTGDIFRWLEDEGLLPRESHEQVLNNAQGPKVRKPTIKAEEERPAEEYCRRCGLHYFDHPTPPTLDYQGAASVGTDAVTIQPNTSATPQGPTAPSTTCPRFNGTQPLNLPVIDVNRLLAMSSQQADIPTRAPYGLHPALFRNPPHGQRFIPPSGARARDLLGASDPELVLAIQGLAVKWKLDRLRAVAGAPGGLTLSLRNDQREDELAPAALLALAVRSFMGMLVESAVAELRRDEAGQRTLQGRARPRRGEQQQQRPRLLTPAHVARGVVHDGARVTACGALVLAMAPLGIALPSMDGATADDTGAPDGDT